MAAKEMVYVVDGGKVYQYKLAGELPTIASASPSFTKPAPKPEKRVKKGGRPKGSKNKPKETTPDMPEVPAETAVAEMVAA